MQNENYTDVYSFLRSMQEEETRRQAQEDYINDTGGDAWLKYARFILTALAEEAGISLAELRRELAFMRLWAPPDETD